MATRTCAEIETDIAALKARLTAIATGKVLEETQYAGSKARFHMASPDEIRRQIQDLEQELRDCNCPNAPRGGGIRVAL